MNRVFRNRAAFTLVEMLIALGVTSIIMAGTYLLILTNQRQQVREDRLRNLVSDTRNVQSFLTTDFRSAGAVLSMFHTQNHVADEVPFNGIQPLNNEDYPDGVILAAGDPSTVTSLTSSFTPGTGNLNVNRTTDADGNYQWQAGDCGLVMSRDGYYIFSVTAVTTSTLSIRGTSVYYSGLLSSAHYDDFVDDQYGTKGNAVTYNIEAPVVRLEYFRIYLVRTEGDNTLTLTLTTDTEDTADIENNETNTMNIPLLENLYDLQMDYVTQDAAPIFWASLRGAGSNEPDPCSNATDTKCVDFRRAFTYRKISNVRIFMMSRSAYDMTRRPGGSEDTIDVPEMGDVAARPGLSKAYYHYQYQEYDIALRNYRIIY